MDATCRPHRELIAQGPFCSIEQCMCGTLHVTIGALTIRLAPEVIESIGTTFREATEHVILRSERASAVSPAAPLAPRARAEKLSS